MLSFGLSAIVELLVIIVIRYISHVESMLCI